MSANLLPATSDSLRLRLASDNEAQRQLALEDVAQSYWKPLYVLSRSLGYDEPGAKDAVQSFFEQLISKDLLSRYDVNQGRLRPWMNTVFRNHLKKGFERGLADKRGAGQQHVPLQLDELEASYQDQLADGGTPETLFDRALAQQLWQSARHSVRAAYEARGRAHVFDSLLVHVHSPEAQEPGDDPEGRPSPDAEDQARKVLRTRDMGRARVELHRLRLALVKAFADQVSGFTAVEDVAGETEHLWALLS